MKRFAFYMLIAAVAAVAACQKQSVIEEPANQAGTYVYTVNASIDDTVKSDYDADGKFSWSAGDAISVLFHKDTDNKFFTLTKVSGTGNTATFSGEITAGYTVGSSNTSKIFALYPASANHSYTPGSNSDYPSFYTPAENDLTGSNFSANIPMYDVRDTEGDFTFKHCACAYKFIIEDVDVSKVKVEVENLESYRLSGLTTMSSSGYLRYSVGDDPAQKKITYICDVTSKKAVFYVSCRYGNDKHFMPRVTIKDNSTGYTIKTVSAGTAVNIPNKGNVQPITISAPGPGSPYVSVYGIDWPNVTATAAGRDDEPYDAIKVIKAAADASTLYVYFEVLKASTYPNTEYSHANLLYVYLGDEMGLNETWQWTTKYNKKFEGWLLQSGVPNYITYEVTGVTSNSELIDGTIYYELAIPRSCDACIQGTSANVSIEANQLYVEGDWAGSNTQIGFAPNTFGPALAVTMPTYVAP